MRDAQRQPVFVSVLSRIGEATNHLVLRRCLQTRRGTGDELRRCALSRRLKRAVVLSLTKLFRCDINSPLWRLPLRCLQHSDAFSFRATAAAAVRLVPPVHQSFLVFLAIERTSIACFCCPFIAMKPCKLAMQAFPFGTYSRWGCSCTAHIRDDCS